MICMMYDNVTSSLVDVDHSCLAFKHHSGVVVDLKETETNRSVLLVLQHYNSGCLG